ncbi:quinol dehydrogenase periplasmic component [Rubripirellula lacrimiformis]|uniref:Quinol dehydrogenase periplasmic component n=1 Tax=Rubripirellula lacrimiformis TaxID=1930273 RepID=A0A517NE54_9BACT|nr:4Fe-4S dicluster domain-containing protein [Rubripirellula lacrimiformis]QDT05402.1 quinol dehydrogenase periplasmic component [Rubripirellula lacrimiformis]
MNPSDGQQRPSVSPPVSSWLRRVLAAVWRLPARAFSFLLKPAPTSRSRRALLQGRLWKLIPASQFAPLVTRLPTPEPQTPPLGKPRSIAGINIDPVPVTNLGRTPVARTIPVHRPPGSIDEYAFLAGCTKCGDCIEACPYDAIVKAPDRLGIVAGTPIIDADSSACMMCQDFPCIASCDAGVLIDNIPPIMGTARVTPHLCLAYHSTTCTVCSERCPVERAITVSDGKPSVNEDVCTGCGVCRYVCPAPENAILLMPAFSRPGIPNA